MQYIFISLMGFFLFSWSSFADEKKTSGVSKGCEIVTIRIPCKGESKMCFDRCKEKTQKCTVKVKADSAKECEEKAASECPLSRGKITYSKKISAHWEGKLVGKEDLCLKPDGKMRDDYGQCEVDQQFAAP